MVGYPNEALSRLSAAFDAVRDPDRALAMSAYMRGQFAFLGIPSPERRRAAGEALAGLPKPSEAGLVALSTALYALPEREYQYVAVDLLAANIAVCGPDFLSNARTLVTTKSWWDTVDGVAAHVVGPLVLAHPQLAAEMDAWVADDNRWVARTAILHQLRFKANTDAGRLFRYCELRAGDTEFFIRKAIGWALREYSKTDPEAVRDFIASHEASLSGLSKREGMLWITGRKQRVSAEG